MQAKSICARKWGGERESEITKSEHMYFMDDPLQKYCFRNDQNFSLTIQYHLNQIRRIKICVLIILIDLFDDAVITELHSKGLFLYLCYEVLFLVEHNF